LTIALISIGSINDACKTNVSASTPSTELLVMFQTANRSLWVISLIRECSVFRERLSWRSWTDLCVIKAVEQLCTAEADEGRRWKTFELSQSILHSGETILNTAFSYYVDAVIRSSS